jgi:hypothetical protein
VVPDGSPPTVRQTRQADRFTDRRRSTLRASLCAGKALPQPCDVDLAQPLAAPIHHPRRTLQESGAGVIILQRAGNIADRPQQPPAARGRASGSGRDATDRGAGIVHSRRDIDDLDDAKLDILLQRPCRPHVERSQWFGDAQWIDAILA